MGLLKKLFSGGGDEPAKPWEQRPAWLTDGISVSLFSGRETLEVVGESSYQDGLELVVRALAQPEHYDRADGGVRVPAHAVLVAETNNPYDENAISIWISGHKAGYLPRVIAADYRAGLLRLQDQEGQPIALECVIVGRPGLFGVFLSHDRGDFGIQGGGVRSTVAPPADSKLRTGLSEAIASDDADDSYDLSWMDSLSGDTARRIPKLRLLLEQEQDLIDRHFMMTQLEADLYACRDLWPTALDEYDEVAEMHHGELVGEMRVALIGKFGAVPLIDTYRQAAVRAQKARDWKRCLEWAERGIAVYGDDAARPEAVEDLRQRVEKATEKLRDG